MKRYRIWLEIFETDWELGESREMSLSGEAEPVVAADFDNLEQAVRYVNSLALDNVCGKSGGPLPLSSYPTGDTGSARHDSSDGTPDKTRLNPHSPIDTRLHLP